MYPCVQGVRCLLGSLPCRLWGCPGTSGAWGRAEMLLCWLGGSPSLPPRQGELRIRGSPGGAGRSRRGGWWVLGHQWVLPNHALRLQRGCQGWEPSGLCCGSQIPCVEGAGGDRLLPGGSCCLLHPCGRKWDCPVPPCSAAVQRGTHEVPRVGTLLAVPWCCCGGGTGPDFGSTAARPGFPALLGLSCSCFPKASCWHSLPWARMHPGEGVASWVWHRVWHILGGRVWHRAGWHQGWVAPRGWH